jgi:hypothetical protein
VQDTVDEYGSESWYSAGFVRLGSLNCCENIDRSLIGRTSRRMGNMGPGIHRAAASRLVGCIRAQARAPTYRCPLLHDPSCQPQLPLPRRPRSPTLRPFSTLPWNHTNVKPRTTYPLIRSFPAFNPANPPRLSSPSSETKSPHSTNLKVATTDSQNGLPQP